VARCNESIRAGVPTGEEETAMVRILTFGLVLTLVATAAWGQTTPTGDQAAQRWFRVSWAPPADGAGTIKGSIFNDSQYRVTDVRLQIEGLDADRHLVGRTLAWAIGDIPPAGETFFAVEPVPGAVDYRITVVSWDLVSRDPAPQAP
jgi:hypothetical protein